MNNEHKLTEFFKNSKKEAFLQSDSWKKFQESTGKEAFHVEDVLKIGQREKICMWANIFINKLPVVGKYLYIPRGPIMIGSSESDVLSVEDVIRTMGYLSDTAKSIDAGWVRLEPGSEEEVVLMGEAIKKIDKREGTLAIKKAPHDTQPSEIFVIDISKSDENLLSEMKSKARYNIRLAEKRGVIVRKYFTFSEKKENISHFLKLNRQTATRDGILTHPEDYYKKMVEFLPEEMIILYLAEYEGKVIAANLVIFFSDTAVYAHGASSNENREVMAPYLLQWMQILDAKERACKYYDFGGVALRENSENKRIVKKWEGITRFKMGFSPKTEPIVFPGSYDIIINPRKYAVYRGLQRAKALLYKIRK